MIILIFTFFIIALIYSSVGLGGGSAYIAVMVLFGVSKDVLPSIALGCNIIVSATSFIRYKKEGFFRWDIFWPFAVTSIPFAYIGGRMEVPEKAFSIIMAVALTLAAVRLVFWKQENINPPSPPFFKGGIFHFLLIGAILGLLAGITGIGGGIYLIPVLIMLNIAEAKEASAVASIFIVLNSASGLFGQLSKGAFDWQIFAPLAGIVLIGGFIGSKIGATKLKGAALQKIVGVILLIAVAKLAGLF